MRTMFTVKTTLVCATPKQNRVCKCLVLSQVLGMIEGLLEAQTRQLSFFWNLVGHSQTDCSALKQRVSGAWYDTLKSIAAKPTRNAQHERQKTRALKVWREAGSFLGFKEGICATTLREVSEPSDEEKYWKIPKRCFWKACPCSSQAPHPVSVCKGCWRVLYCSPKCQRS